MLKEKSARASCWAPSVTRRSPAPMRRETRALSAPSASTVLESYCVGPALRSTEQEANRRAVGSTIRERLMTSGRFYLSPINYGSGSWDVPRKSESGNNGGPGAVLEGGANLCRGGYRMLHWSLIFLVIALIAAVLGFGGIAGTAVGIAK